MFLQYKFIAINHHVALESCVRNHPIVTAQLLARLYNCALSSTEKATGEAGMSVSHMNCPDYKVGTATDDKTGFYVQLAKVTGKEGVLLTVGTKWVMERINTVHGNTSTTLW